MFRIRVAIDQAVPKLGGWRRGAAEARNDAFRQSRARAAEPLGSAVQPGRSRRSRNEHGMALVEAAPADPPGGGGGMRPRFAGDGRRPLRPQGQSAGPEAPLPDLDQGRDDGRAGHHRRRSRTVAASAQARAGRDRPARNSGDTALGPQPFRRSREGRRAGDHHSRSGHGPPDDQHDGGRPPFHRSRDGAFADSELRSDRSPYAHQAQPFVEQAGQLSAARPRRSWSCRCCSSLPPC